MLKLLTFVLGIRIGMNQKKKIFVTGTYLITFQKNVYKLYIGVFEKYSNVLRKYYVFPAS